MLYGLGSTFNSLFGILHCLRGWKCEDARAFQLPFRDSLDDKVVVVELDLFQLPFRDSLPPITESSEMRPSFNSLFGIHILESAGNLASN